MIELPPKLDNKTLNKVLIGKSDIDANLIVDKINEDYDYWDKVKYKPLPNGYNPTMLWSHVKASRYKGRIPVWDKYGINLCVTNHMQRICHEFDMIFGMGISNESCILDLAVQYDIIQKSGAWFSYNGEKIGQGRENVRKLLVENVEFCEQIEKQVREKFMPAAE